MRTFLLDSTDLYEIIDQLLSKEFISQQFNWIAPHDVQVICTTKSNDAIQFMNVINEKLYRKVLIPLVPMKAEKTKVNYNPTLLSSPFKFQLCISPKEIIMPYVEEKYYVVDKWMIINLPYVKSESDVKVFILSLLSPSNILELQDCAFWRIIFKLITPNLKLQDSSLFEQLDEVIMIKMFGEVALIYAPDVIIGENPTFFGNPLYKTVQSAPIDAIHSLHNIVELV